MIQEEQIKELTKLKELLDSGVLSETEFAQEKARIMSDNEKRPSSPNNQQTTIAKKEAEDKNRAILPLQILFFVATVVMFVLFIVLWDPVVFGIIGLITAIITIVLSWIKSAKIPNTYAIISTIVAGLMGLLMLITP